MATSERQSICRYFPDNARARGKQLVELYTSKLHSHRPKLSLRRIFHNLEALQSVTPYPFLVHIQDEKILNHTRARNARGGRDLLAKWNGVFDAVPTCGEACGSKFSFLRPKCKHNPDIFPPVICQDQCERQCSGGLRCEATKARVYVLKKRKNCLERANWQENWTLQLFLLRPPTFGACTCQPLP